MHRLAVVPLVLALLVSLPGCSESDSTKHASQEFQRNLRYEVAEEMLEEEGFTPEEAAEARGFAEKEHVGAQGAAELGAAAKAAR